MNGSSLRVQIKEERKQARANGAKEQPVRSAAAAAQARGRRSAAAASAAVVLPSMEELLKATPPSRAVRCTPREDALREAPILSPSSSLRMVKLPPGLYKLLSIQCTPRREPLVSDRREQRAAYLLSLVHKDEVKEAAGPQAASLKLKGALLCDLAIDLARPETCAVSSELLSILLTKLAAGAKATAKARGVTEDKATSARARSRQAGLVAKHQNQ